MSRSDGGVSSRGGYVSPEEQSIIDNTKANGTYLLAPNGRPTNLTPRQWVQVRTEAFKQWFGDWEAFHWAKILINSNAITLDNETSLSKKEAEEIVSNLENGKNKFDGRETTWVKSSVGKILRHKGFDSSLLIPKLKDVYDNSVPILSEHEIKKDGHKIHNNFKGYHHYVGKIQLNGNEYYVRFTLQELNTKKKDFIPNQLHSTFVSDINIYSTNNRVNTGNNPATANVDAKYIDTKLSVFFEKSKLLEGIDSIKREFANEEMFSTVKDKRLISILQTNASKIVDENGEPMVVYRGTPQRMGYTFEYGHNFYGGNKGFWFTTAKTAAKDYSFNYDTGFYGEIKEVFLNIRNPMDLMPLKRHTTSKRFYEFIKQNFNIHLGRGSSKEYPTHELYEKFQDFLYPGIHDGIKLEDVGHTYIAKTPNQIKSATDNIGTFDNRLNDIRFRNSSSASRSEDRGGGRRPEGLNQVNSPIDTARQDQIFISQALGNPAMGSRGIKVTPDEYAKIAHNIATYPNKVERGHVFTDNYYYLCTNISDDGYFNIIAQLPIEGNEELINKLRGKNGRRNFKALERTEDIASTIKEVKRRGGRIDRNIPPTQRQTRVDGRNDNLHLGQQPHTASNQRPLDRDDDTTTRFRVANHNQAIFVSNARQAVENIRQDRATPEQWLAMLQKNGGITADNLLLIPEVIANGTRTEKGKGKIEYRYTHDNGTKYTVLTEKNNRGAEVFADFYTNKSGNARSSNTQLSAQADSITALSADKDNINSVNNKTSFRSIRPGETLTDYARAVVANSPSARRDELHPKSWTKKENNNESSSKESHNLV